MTYVNCYAVQEDEDDDDEDDEDDDEEDDDDVPVDGVQIDEDIDRATVQLDDAINAVAAAEVPAKRKGAAADKERFSSKR